MTNTLWPTPRGGSGNSRSASRLLLVLRPHLLPAWRGLNTLESGFRTTDSARRPRGTARDLRERPLLPRSPSKGRCWASPPTGWQSLPTQPPGRQCTPDLKYHPPDTRREQLCTETACVHEVGGSGLEAGFSRAVARASGRLGRPWPWSLHTCVLTELPVRPTHVDPCVCCAAVWNAVYAKVQNAMLCLECPPSGPARGAPSTADGTLARGQGRRPHVNMGGPDHVLRVGSQTRGAPAARPGPARGPACAVTPGRERPSAGGGSWDAGRGASPRSEGRHGQGPNPVLTRALFAHMQDANKFK